jgi:hypothetical protein
MGLLPFLLFISSSALVSSLLLFSFSYFIGLHPRQTSLVLRLCYGLNPSHNERSLLLTPDPSVPVIHRQRSLLMMRLFPSRNSTTYMQSRVQYRGGAGAAYVPCPSSVWQLKHTHARSS